MKEVSLGASIMICIASFGIMGSGEIFAGLLTLAVGVIWFVFGNKPDKPKNKTT